jgi:hypothetical protein
VGLARKQGGQVDENGGGRVDAAKRLLHRLPVVADRLKLAHNSIIRSIGFHEYLSVLVRAFAL